MREPNHKYSHLTRAQREIIRRMLCQKKSHAEIARLLGKHRSTVSREVRRNRSDVAGVQYFEVHAHARAMRRRLEAKTISRKIDRSEALQSILFDMLRRKFSPEQIVGTFRRTNLKPPVSHTTIYAWISRNRRTMKHYLRHKGRHRIPYGQRKRIWEPNKRHISERSLAGDMRLEIGHWEADLVHGNQDDSRHCLLTLVERVTRFCVVWKVRSLNAEYVSGIMALALQNMPVASITCDNGIEFAHRCIQA